MFSIVKNMLKKVTIFQSIKGCAYLLRELFTLATSPVPVQMGCNMNKMGFAIYGNISLTNDKSLIWSSKFDPHTFYSIKQGALH